MHIEFPAIIQNSKTQPRIVVVSDNVGDYPNSIHIKECIVGGDIAVLITDQDSVQADSQALIDRGAVRVYPVQRSTNDLIGAVDEVIRTLRAASPNDEPSRSILHAARSCSAKLGPGIFGKAGPLVDSLARLSGAPREFVANGMIAVVSGIMTGRNHVQVRQGFRVPLTAYCVNIGDPSSQKSPAMDVILTPVVNLQSKMRAKAKAQAAMDQESSDKKLPPAPEPRLMASDASVEALYKISADNQGGIILALDEFSSLVNQLTRYSKSGMGDSGSYLSAYNAQPLTVDRKTQPSLDIPCWGLSLFSNCPPAVLDRFAERSEIDDGFDARLWYMFPEPPMLTLRPEDGDAQALAQWARIVDTLVQWRIEAGDSRPMTFTDDALSAFESWRLGLLTKARAGGREVTSWVGKLPGTVAKLAGILAILDAAVAGTKRPTRIDKSQLQRAGSMADLYTAHRRRVELSRGAPPIQKLVANMAAWIIDHKITSISPFELRAGTGIIPGARSRKVVHDILRELYDARWIETPIPAHHSDPLPTQLIVNPKVHAAS